MTEGIHQIGTGLNALVQELETVSHNVANAQTAGFKRQVTSFHLELQKQLEAQNGKRKFSGIPIESRQTMDFSQGGLVETGRSLDIALEGKGYLVLETPEGPLFTRNGCFQVNLLGQLVDSASRIVAGQNGPIVLPPSVGEMELQISADGTISARGSEIGKLRLVTFGERESQLQPGGLGALKAPKGLVPQPADAVRVRQGYQESSNVKVIEEMVSLMTLSRLYETNMSILRRQQDNSQALLGAANS